MGAGAARAGGAALACRGRQRRGQERSDPADTRRGCGTEGGGHRVRPGDGIPARVLLGSAWRRGAESAGRALPILDAVRRSWARGGGFSLSRFAVPRPSLRPRWDSAENLRAPVESQTDAGGTGAVDGPGRGDRAACAGHGDAGWERGSSRVEDGGGCGRAAAQRGRDGAALECGGVGRYAPGMGVSYLEGDNAGASESAAQPVAGPACAAGVRRCDQGPEDLVRAGGAGELATSAAVDGGDDGAAEVASSGGAGGVQQGTVGSRVWQGNRGSAGATGDADLAQGERAGDGGVDLEEY